MRRGSHRVYTSRNWLERISWAIARGWPDLIGSSEGGSNLILARRDSGGIAERRELVIQERRPERRTMAFARLGFGLCVDQPARQHRSPRAEPELLLAAERATEWAGDAPLVSAATSTSGPAGATSTRRSSAALVCAESRHPTRSTTCWSAA